jgi:uncharacterized protein
MKYLLVLAVLVVAFWVWRNNRQEETRSNAQAARNAKPRTPGAPTTMVACLQCGTHLPESDAVRTAQGYFCGSEHLHQFEHKGRG